MLGREKPFEVLSSKEEEAFKLASEITLWTNDQRFYNMSSVVELRGDATKLYEMASNMDMENDDKYYRVHEAFNQLRDRYDRLRVNLEDKQWIDREFDLDKESIDDVVSATLKNLPDARQVFRLSHHNHRRGYGQDMIEFIIARPLSRKEEFDVSIDEMFHYEEYETPYVEALHAVLERRYGRAIDEISQVGGRFHDFGYRGVWTVFRGVDSKELENILRDVLVVVKENPRKLKVK